MPHKDREAYLAYQREYNRNRREKQIAYGRQWRRDYPEKALAAHRNWKAKNPEARRDLWRRMHLSRRGLRLSEADAVFARAVRLDPCAYCGGPGGEVDHITCVRDGGTSHWENLTSACRSCNASKSYRSVLHFLADR